MRYLLLVSHGTLASGMAQALGMLVGEREDVRQVAFQDGMGLPAFKEEVEKVRAIGGMNLPMAVTAVEEEDSPLDETVAAMMACAAEQVKQFSTDEGSEDDI